MTGSPRSTEAGERQAMVPESLSSFEQMLTSFAYSPVGIATPVGGAGDDGVAGGTRKKQVKTEGEATPKWEKKTPAPLQTPPRPPRRRGGRSSPSQPDWAAAGDGTMADKSTAMVTMQGDSAIDSTSVTVEDERREGLVPASAPGTPFVLPADKNRGSSSYYLREDVRRNPPTFSRFFLRQSTSAPADGEGEAGETRREYTKVAGEEGGKGNPFPDCENKGILIGAARKRKKRRKGSCRGAGASRPRGKNERDRDEQQKSKKKKVVVVSPYFSAASSDQHATERGAGEVEMIVQRRTRTKKKRTDQAAEPTGQARTSGGGNEGSPEVADGKKKRKRKHQSVQLSAAERMADAYKRVPDDNKWVPPFSDHELLQEFHFFDHWRVLIICMLLNRTTGREVQKVLPRLFLLCPDAETTTKVSEDDIEEIIKHLGLQRKRSKMIKRMSEEYLQPEWTHVTQLHGIGKYAADAYAIFCSGMWKGVKPNDHKLVDYWRFLLNDKDARESMMVQKST
ncbi:hypothetical protein Taro_023747 [Colocasia esculenta]|uniref:HhH-GPD domain-containing protein n=1 Tax=Colocasia esculenta TaxID=4460 RepID=A0A843V4K3_COLES|nr:hypothetical protein [Colocasia esculenta]